MSVRRCCFARGWPGQGFGVVVALRDRTAPTVCAALVVTLRRSGGGPTHVLTDNEKTVTKGHMAGVAVATSRGSASSGTTADDPHL